MSYQILKINILQSESDILINQASKILKSPKELGNHKIVYLQNGPKKASFRLVHINLDYSLKLLYPANNFGDYLLLERNISTAMRVLDTIFINILFIIIFACVCALFYALFLSKLFSLHMRSLAMQIAQVEHDFNERLKPASFPVEFSPIITGLNHLIERVRLYNSTQKELFLGITHELKTPLAIIKAKNDVALLKERQADYYKTTLNESNQSILHMNKIISEILKIGRNEGAAFEESTEIDLGALIAKLCANYSLLVGKKHQSLRTEFCANLPKVRIQATLFTQILQNFIQNALKFSPNYSEVLVRTSFCEKEFLLEVLDSGCGCDESKDLFAPFKRYGSEEGIGLGLYLCKVAACALNGEVGIANRKDAKGCRAWFKFRPNTI